MERAARPLSHLGKVQKNKMEQSQRRSRKIVQIPNFLLPCAAEKRMPGSVPKRTSSFRKVGHEAVSITYQGLVRFFFPRE